MLTTKFTGTFAGIVCRNAVARNTVRHLSAPPPPPGDSSRGSGGVSGGGKNKVYELRIYQMKPEHYRDSLDLMAKYWPVRTAHSKPVGSWMTEIGGICETVHLWEYDGLGDRMARRLKIAADPAWTKEFWPAFFKKSLTLKCYLLSPTSGSVVNTNFDPASQGLYELQRCEPYTPLVPSVAGESVVGQFFTVYGPTPAEFILLRYTNADLAYEKALARRKSQGLKGYSRFLVPCHWSELK
ncbi:hypothetical protein V1264_001112 [Littorina saxatilis]